MAVHRPVRICTPIRPKKDKEAPNEPEMTTENGVLRARPTETTRLAPLVAGVPWVVTRNIGTTNLVPHHIPPLRYARENACFPGYRADRFT